MARRHHYEGFGEEVKYQLRRYGRVFKREVGSFGREAAHQLGTGWGEEFARQIFGPPRRRRRSR